VSVTDGSLTTDGAAQTVRLVGTVTTSPTGTQTVAGTVTANQGTAAAVAQAWPIKNTDGTNTANIAVPGPNLGAGLVVSSGTLIASTTLSAVSATGAGTVADFGSAKQNITLVITAGTGVSAGAVALEVSQDNTNWFRGTPVTQSAPGVTQSNQQGAWRYGRANVTTTITGGTVSATLMAS